MPAHLGDIEEVRITTADGVELEGELVAPPGAAGTVLLCHPHPQFGGSMRSLVTSELFQVLPGHDIAVLRFNFRGVEGSGGTHGNGVDERLDVQAALDLLCDRSATPAPITAGWSFGADVSLTVLDQRLAGWFCIAPPLRVLPAESFLASDDPRPKFLAVPEHDQYDPPPLARQKTAGWTNTTLEVIDGADHFLVGRTTKVAERLLAFVDALHRWGEGSPSS
ncbi:MAG: hypothetical protein HYX32_02405 [Actinobacteria bacterium]|nr:hypothetical protein [Actinomycetota bacterium]